MVHSSPGRGRGSGLGHVGWFIHGPDVAAAAPSARVERGGRAAEGRMGEPAPVGDLKGGLSAGYGVLMDGSFNLPGG
jgi:hypothetical protein